MAPLPHSHCRSITRRPLALYAIALLLLTGASGRNAHASDDTISLLKQLSVEELLDIEVTSVSKRPEKLLEAASAIQVVTGEDIRRSGAATIPQALRMAGNLQVAQKGSRSWAISARGFNTDLANKLLVLIDGRAVYTPLFSGVFWERQDYLLEDIDRIEVISGPGGTLWGANAVNGVVNITTKAAKDTQGGHWEAGLGTDLRTFTGGRYGGTLAPNVHFRVYGKYSDWDGALLADGSDADGEWHMTQGGFRIDAETSPQESLTLQGDIYSTRESVGASNAVRERGHNLLARWSRRLANDSDFSLQVYYDHTRLDTPAPPLIINGLELAPGGTLSDDLDTFDLDFHHRLPRGDTHQLIWGLGYRFTRDVLSNAPSLAFLPPELDQELFSGFIQDEIRLRDNLTLTLGAKIEHNDYTGVETEPGVRMQWRLSPDRMLWAAISRAVRMPSRIDRDLSQPAPEYLVLLKGGPDFDSETVVAYELGYRTQWGGRTMLSASVFYNEYRDLRSTSLTPATLLPLFFENNVEGESCGLELDLIYQATDWWSLHASYNFLDTDLRVKPGQFDFNNALNETSDPKHQFSVRSSWDLPNRWELDTAFRWIDSLAINDAGVPAVVPSYMEVDVRLAWRPSERTELSLVGQNLLHDRHPEYGLPDPNRKEIARSVYGKATWRF